MRVRTVARAAALAALAALAAPAPAAPAAAEEFTAVAIPTGGAGAAGATTINITIERYANSEEKALLANAFAEGGNDEFMRRLSKMEMGRIGPVGRVGVEINAAISEPSGKGRTITILAQRPISIWELRDSSITTQYRLGAATLELDEENKGEGSLVIAGRIDYKDGRPVIERFGYQPVRLLNVRPE